MLKTSLAMAATLAFISAQAAILAPEDFTVRTMADLAKLCSASETPYTILLKDSTWVISTGRTTTTRP